MKNILILTLITLFVSCTNIVEINSDFSETKSSEICITDNRDYQRYFAISKELLMKVAECDLTVSEIIGFLSASDYDAIYNEINANASDLSKYDSLSIYTSRVADIYTADTVNCSLCSYSQEELAESFASIITWIRTNPNDFDSFELSCSELKDSGGTKCAWVQLAACIGACTTLPPILNAICVVACYCDFCTRESGHPMNEPCGQTTQ